VPHRSRLQSCVPPLFRVRFAPHVPSIQLEQIECKAGTLARPGDGSAIGRTPAARRRHTPPPPPSIRNERARSLPAAAAISGKRPDQSGPLRVISRTPAGSRRTIMRKCLISWTQPRPDGGQSAGEGGQCSINARHADSRGFFRSRWRQAAAPAARIHSQGAGPSHRQFFLSSFDTGGRPVRRPRLGSQVNLRSDETGGPPILCSDVRANQLFSASARFTKVVARLGTT